MVEVLECHSSYLSRQRLRQLSAVLRIKTESMLRELRLCRLPGAAKFAVHWSLYDDARRALVRCLRNFKVHIAVSGVHAGLLHKRSRDVKHLEFAAGSWGIRGYEGVLRPA